MLKSDQTKISNIRCVIADLGGDAFPKNNPPPQERLNDETYNKALTKIVACYNLREIYC